MGKKASICVVMSPALDRDLIFKFLNSPEYKTDIVEPEKFKSHNFLNYDLLIVDEQVALRNREIINELKNANTYIYYPVLVTTTMDMSETRWFRCQFDELLRLPISKSELISRVQILLKLRWQTIELKHMSDLGRKLSASKTPKEAAMTILNTADALIGWDAAYLHFYSTSINRIYPIIYIDTIDGEKREFAHVQNEKNLQNIVKDTFTDTPKLILRSEQDLNEAKLEPFGNTVRLSKSLMFVPIKKGDKTIGFLSIQSYEQNAYRQKDLEMLQLLSDHCSDALDRTFAEWQLHQSEEHLAMLASQMPSLLWSVNNNLIITSFYGMGLKDISIKDAVGKGLDFILKDSPSFEHLIDIHRKSLAGESIVDEIHLRSKFFQCYLKPLRDTEQNIIGCIGVALDISERKKSEEELKKIHHIYHEAIQNAEGVPYQLNYTSMNYDYISDECEAIFEVPKNHLTRDMLRKMIKETVITDQGAPKSLERYIEDFRHGKVNRYRVDFKIETPSGEIKWVSDCSVPIKDDKSENVIGALGILTDITDRKLAEEAVAKRAERVLRYQNAILGLSKLNAPDLHSAIKRIAEIDSITLNVERVGIWFFDKMHTKIECKTLYVKNTGEYLSGFTMKASDYPDYFKEIESCRALCAHDALADHRTKSFLENYLIPNKIGSMMDIPIWIRGKVEGIICHEHIGSKRVWEQEEQEFAASVADYIALAFETFERRRAEEEQRHIAIQLQSIFEALPDLYFRFASDGTILDCRASNTNDIYGSPSTFLGKKVQEHLPKGVGIKIIEAIKNVCKTKTFEIVEYSLPLPKGEQIFESRLLPLFEDQVIGIVRNITERKQAERERQVFTRLATRLSGCNSAEAIKKVVYEESEILLGWDAHYFAVFIPNKPIIHITSFVDTVNGEKTEFPAIDWNLQDLGDIYNNRLSKGKSVLINRIPGSENPMLTKFGNRSRISASLIFVPVRSGEKVIGIISAQSYTVGKYGEYDLNLALRIADIVAPALERANAEEALRESELRYRAIVEDQTELICQTLPDGEVTFVNEAYCRYYNIKREDIVGKKRASVIPDEYWDIMNNKTASLTKENPMITFETNFKFPDNIKRWQQWAVRAFFDKDDAIYKLQSVGRDITELKLAEEQIKSALKEKEMLLKEIHHRVKNNLQIISSLLNLQSKTIKNEKIIDAIKESQDRIRSMAIIHEKLYQSKDLSMVNFGDYIRSIVSNLFRSYTITSDRIKLDISVEDIFLDIDTAIPCGLIINELVSNSLKHGFKTNRKGEINILLNRENEKRLKLVVKDDGVGIQENFDYKNTESLGLRLICTLVEQLSGEIILNRANGTEFIIVFSI